MHPYRETAPLALERRVEQLRRLAHEDHRLESVLLYGSWTVGEADAHSDIEAYLFVADEYAQTFDTAEFVARLAPLKLAYTNMYGVTAVVFDDLMRGEFHGEPAGAAIEAMAGWVGMVHLPDPAAAVLLDRTGRLSAAAERLAEFRPPEPVATARQRTDELANWTLMVAHLLQRGEAARAHSVLLSVVAPQQLQLCRLLRGSTAHWLTPSRALEADLPEEDQRRYREATSDAALPQVRRAARSSWAWSRELAGEAAARWQIEVPVALHEEISVLLDGPEPPDM